MYKESFLIWDRPPPSRIIRKLLKSCAQSSWVNPWGPGELGLTSDGNWRTGNKNLTRIEKLFKPSGGRWGVLWAKITDMRDTLHHTIGPHHISLLTVLFIPQLKVESISVSPWLRNWYVSRRICLLVWCHLGQILLEISGLVKPSGLSSSQADGAPSLMTSRFTSWSVPHFSWRS